MAQTAAEQLAKLYETAQKRLTEIITKKASYNSPAFYERRLLKQVTAELQRVKKATPEVVKQLVLEGYKTGLESLAEDLTKTNYAEPPALNLFSRLNTGEINLMVQNVVDDLTQAVNLVGRRMEDEIRQAGLNASALKESTGGTVRAMQKDLEKRLMGLDLKQPDGKIGVKYKNHRVVPLDTYSKMVARTTPAEAQNKAKLVQGAALGHDLVKITEHSPTCEVCAKYQGRVYALTAEAATGKYKGPDGEPLYFPLLYETALQRGYETIHPSCRHRLRILVAAFYTAKELKAMSDYSMRPFKDNRADDERKAYAAEQAENRQRNQDYRQWQRYTSQLGSDVPNFAGFRSMKRADSERWALTQLDYRRRRELLINPEMALPNAETVTVAEPKFTKYLFNPDNKDGYAKGVAFDDRLGYNIDNWQELQKEIINRAPLYPVALKYTNEYGNGYEQKIILYGEKGKPANVIVGWLEKDGETKMTTCYIKEVE